MGAAMNRLRQRLGRIGAPLRVCLSACVYEPDPERRRLRQMLDSAVVAGTTDFAIAVDRKSAPLTVWWVRWHLLRRRGLIASLLRPARVVTFQWQDDFAHARNAALDLVQRECDWWYAIDADDALMVRDGRSLPEVLAMLPDGVLTLGIAYEVPDQLGHVVERMSYETFWRLPITYRWERAWGEMLNPLDRSRTMFIDAVVRRHDQDRALPRGSRNPRVMDKALAENPNDTGLLIFRAQSHGSSWRLAEAWSCFELALEVSQQPRYRYGIAFHAVDALIMLGRLDDAIALCGEAKQWCPQLPDLHLKAARVLYLQGRFADAISEAQAGIDRLGAYKHFGERQHTGSGGNPVVPYEVEPFLILAQAQAQLGDFTAAMENAERVWAADPPLGIVLALHELLAYIERQERPPFAATFPERMAATMVLVERIRGYETVGALLRDADRIALEVDADGADTNHVVAFMGAHFQERGEAWMLPPAASAERPTRRGETALPDVELSASACPEVYYSVGLALVAMYRLEDAERPMRRVLEALDMRSPSHRPLWPTLDRAMRHMAHAVLADVAAAKGDHVGAIEHADRGLPLELPGCSCNLFRLRAELVAMTRPASREVAS